MSDRHTRRGRPSGLLLNTDVLRAVRERRLLSQGELAELARVSLRTVQRAEAGERVSASALRDLARVLGLEAHALLRPSDAEIDERLSAVGHAAPGPPARWIPRDREIDACARGLAPDLAGPAVVTAVGPSGIGKSSIARRIARDLRAGFDAVVWIEASSLASVERRQATQLEIAGVFGFLDALGSPLERSREAYERAFAHLLWQRRVLIVIDDVEPTSALESFVVSAVPTVRCLLTTRFRQVADRWSTSVVNVGALPDEAVHEALVGLVGPARLAADSAGARRLVELAGGATQSALLIGRGLAMQEFMTPSQYADLVARGAGAGSPRPALDRALSTLSPGARELLASLAVFGEAPFDVAWVVAGTGATEHVTRAALAELTDAYLLAVDRPSAPAVLDHAVLRLPAAVAASARELAGEERFRAADLAYARTLGAIAQRVNGEGWTACARWFAERRTGIESVFDALLIHARPMPPIEHIGSVADLPASGLAPEVARALVEFTCAFDLRLAMCGTPGASERVPLAAAAARDCGFELEYGRLARLIGYLRALSPLGVVSSHTLLVEAVAIFERLGARAWALGTTSQLGAMALASPTPEDNLRVQADVLARALAAPLDDYSQAALLNRLAYLQSRYVDARARDEHLRAAVDTFRRAELLAAKAEHGRWLAAVARWNGALLSHLSAAVIGDGELAEAARALADLSHPDAHVMRMLLAASLGAFGDRARADERWGDAREALQAALTLAGTSPYACESIITLGFLLFFASFPRAHAQHAAGTVAMLSPVVGHPDAPPWEYEPMLLHASSWPDEVFNAEQLVQLELLLGPAYVDSHLIRQSTRAFLALQRAAEPAASPS